MTKVNTTTDARVLVGIDISKNRHEVLIAVPAKTRRRRMTVLQGFATKTRDKKAALRFLKKAIRVHARCEQYATDDLRFYGAA